MRRFAGLDLNGLHDHVARSWLPHGDEPLEAGRSREVVDCGIGSAVVRLAAEERALGGPQALLAPHGRGPGWGAIGAEERRRDLVALIGRLEDAADGEAAEGLAEIVRSLAPGAEQTVLAAPDVKAFDDAAQQRFLDALRAAGSRRPYLLWRSVALALVAIERGEVREGETLGLIEHAARGLRLQRLTIKGSDKGRVLAPERRSAGSELAWTGGLACLHAAAVAELAAADRDLSAAVMAAARLPWSLALGQRPEAEVLRRSNGQWLRLAPPETSRSLPAAPAELEGRLADCDRVLLDTPLAGERRHGLQRDLSVRLAGRLRPVQPGDAALGCLLAAERLARGTPLYFDFLPQISVLVMQRDGAGFEGLVPEGSSLPANETYRTLNPPRYRWPAGQKSLQVYLEKQGAPAIRRWEVRLPEAPKAEQEVTLHLEQRPAQGLARIDIRSATWPLLAHRPLHLDWSRLEEDGRGREQIIAEVQKPAPGYPDRLVLPSGPEAWTTATQGPSFLDLLRAGQRGGGYAYKALADRLSQGVVPDKRNRRRLRPLDSDGVAPDGVDVAALDLAIAAAAGGLRASAAAGTPEPDNDRLRFVTWCFGRCPDDIQEELLRAAQDGTHPWRQPRRSDVVVLQGIGRCLDDEAAIRRALDRLLRIPPADFKSDQRACLAFLLARKDATTDALSETEVGEIARLTADLLRAELKGSFSRRFHYTLQMAAGLLRARRRFPYAFLPESDPAGLALRDRLQAIADRLDGRRGQQRKLGLVEEIQKHLEGSGGAPDLLIGIFDSDGDPAQGETADP